MRWLCTISGNVSSAFQPPRGSAFFEWFLSSFSTDLFDLPVLRPMLS